MDKFTKLTGIAAPLIINNVDTDTIIPSREMKTVSKLGLGEGLFAAWRYSDEKTRKKNPKFVLNRAPFQSASILLSGNNFGCGSSREHAVWALKEFGIKCIIAESFGAIFYRNCVANGILAIRLPSVEITRLANNSSKELAVDLNHQSISSEDLEVDFEFAKGDKFALLNGIDPITETLSMQSLIDEFRIRDQSERPWMHTP